MHDRPSLSRRIADAELAVAQCDQRVHDLTHELRPSALRTVHDHGKAIAVSAVVVVVAGVLLYPKRAAIMSSQLGHKVWNMALSMGMPWLVQHAASAVSHKDEPEPAVPQPHVPVGH